MNHKLTLSAALIGGLLLAACSQAPNGTANQSAATSAAATSTVSPAAVNTGDNANGATTVSLEKAKALVSGASHNQATATAVFAGKDGMTGIITGTEGRPKEVVWASPNGSLLFPGPALDINGNNLSANALTEQNVYLSATKLADRILTSDNAFTVGKKGPVVTAFMDPNCSWCHELYVKIMPAVDQGKVRVRFVMVGFLKPTSVARATAILAAKNPADALKKDETSFNSSAEEGGVAPLAQPRPDIEAKVQANTALMGEAGPISTPGLLFCDKSNNNEVTYVRGYPQDMDGFLAKLSDKGHGNCKK